MLDMPVRLSCRLIGVRGPGRGVGLGARVQGKAVRGRWSRRWCSGRRPSAGPRVDAVAAVNEFGRRAARGSERGDLAVRPVSPHSAWNARAPPAGRDWTGRLGSV